MAENDVEDGVIDMVNDDVSDRMGFVKEYECILMGES